MELMNADLQSSVYPGMTIAVRFTAEEKAIQEKKVDENFEKEL